MIGSGYRRENRRVWNRRKAEHIVRLVKIVATEPTNKGAEGELTHLLETIFNHEDERVFGNG